MQRTSQIVSYFFAMMFCRWKYNGEIAYNVLELRITQTSDIHNFSWDIIFTWLRNKHASKECSNGLLPFVQNKFDKISLTYWRKYQYRYDIICTGLPKQWKMHLHDAFYSKNHKLAIINIDDVMCTLHGDVTMVFAYSI